MSYHVGFMLEIPKIWVRFGPKPTDWRTWLSHENTLSDADFDRSWSSYTSIIYAWKSAGKYGPFTSRLSRSLKIIENDRSIGHIPLIHSNHSLSQINGHFDRKTTNCSYASIQIPLLRVLPLGFCNAGCAYKL